MFLFNITKKKMYNIFALLLLIFINYVSIYIKQLAEAYIILRNEHQQLNLNKIKIIKNYKNL